MDTMPLPKTTPDGAEPPKKYIRTLEGDMQTIKDGGTPDLTPFKKPESLKTYEGDFSDRVKETGASTATILAAEQDAAKEAPQETPHKPSRENIFYSIAGVALLILGGVGVYLTYTRYEANTQPVTLAPTLSTPIFVDEREKITGETSAALLLAINESLSRSLAPNTVRLLYAESETASSTSVFSVLQLSAPDVLLRNINAASSMAGIVSVGDTQSAFFILSVSSYGDTFAGMLQWEPTMVRDMKSLFPQYPVQTVSTTSVATSTPPVQPVFRDEVVSNHDVRLYRDDEGRSILIYGYWNKTTLVIARDQAAFTEIVGRLATSRTVR